MKERNQNISFSEFFLIVFFESSDKVRFAKSDVTI